jgi:diacylglycerol kinase (ATP)
MKKRRYKIIVNPAAGRGNGGKCVKQIEAVFRKNGAAFDLEITCGPGHAAEIAKASLGSFDAIVAAGGDGTVREVVSPLLHTGVPLGVIPIGSGNDLVKSLGIPRDPVAAAEFALRGESRVIDAARADGTCFVNGMGIGFDAMVNHQTRAIANARPGLSLYVRALLRTLGKYKPVPLRVAAGETVADQDVFLLAIGNGTTCGGGFRLTPHARVDDGLLDVTIVDPLSVPRLLMHLPKVFRGTIDRAAEARLSRAEHITVECRSTVPVHIDGEGLVWEEGRHKIDVIPAALTVIAQY